ncbi:GM18715 [Drosophila sechellia]|uniref:GM18715 n=1 Tax=Drosophila sechellia TaxID=7238 RepID=B4I2A3_DROSE|nr:GM18715 [Drosophila sechellia]
MDKKRARQIKCLGERTNHLDIKRSTLAGGRWNNAVDKDMVMKMEMALELGMGMGIGTAPIGVARDQLSTQAILHRRDYPDFGLLLSFVGSFCLAQLGLILPGVVDICLRYEEDYGPGRIFLIRSMLFICMGLAGGVAGTVVTLQTLYARYPVVKR